jgi:hypothetical protein
MAFRLFSKRQLGALQQNQSSEARRKKENPASAGFSF